jgi:hypothetical protein
MPKVYAIGKRGVDRSAQSPGLSTKPVDKLVERTGAFAPGPCPARVFVEPVKKRSLYIFYYKTVCCEPLIPSSARIERYPGISR